MRSHVSRRGLSNLTILLSIVGVGVLALVIAVIVIGVAYWSAPRGRGANQTENPVVKVAPPPQSAELSDEELTEFAARLERAIRAADVDAAMDLMDLETTIDTTLTGTDAESELIIGMRQGMRQGYRGLIEEIVRQGSDGRYRFLRVRQIDGRPRLLFRLAPINGSINYHELLVDRPNGQNLLIVDLYVYVAGELISQNMRRMMLPAIAQFDKSWVEKLTQGDREFVEHYTKLVRINELRIANQNPEALRLLEALPPSMRALKPIMLTRNILAASSDEAEYLAAMQDYRQAFPSDPSLLLLEIDFHLLRKEHDKSLQAINRLDTAVGGDPYLDLHRTGVLIDAQRWSEALATVDAFIKNFPENLQIYWHLTSIGLRQPDHALVLETLKRIDQNFTIEWSDLTQSADYAQFVKSPEYQEWLAYLAEREPDDQSLEPPPE